jgi:hypothetical protein
MFYVYIKTEDVFDPKKLVGEYGSLEKARQKAESEVAKNHDVKYVIEETTGFVDNYGELIADVVEEN